MRGGLAIWKPHCCINVVSSDASINVILLPFVKHDVRCRFCRWINIIDNDCLWFSLISFACSLSVVACTCKMFIFAVFNRSQKKRIETDGLSSSVIRNALERKRKKVSAVLFYSFIYSFVRSFDRYINLFLPYFFLSSSSLVRMSLAFVTPLIDR